MKPTAVLPIALFLLALPIVVATVERELGKVVYCEEQGFEGVTTIDGGFLSRGRDACFRELEDATRVYGKIPKDIQKITIVEYIEREQKTNS